MNAEFLVEELVALVRSIHVLLTSASVDSQLLEVENDCLASSERGFSGRLIGCGKDSSRDTGSGSELLHVGYLWREW